MIIIKLWEYVLKHDDKSEYIKWLADTNEKESELIIKEEYCPNYFECFNNTEFKNPLYPYHSREHEKNECKCQDTEILSHKYKCAECWNREIIDKHVDKDKDDEYKLYLKLKEKYENR